MIDPRIAELHERKGALEALNEHFNWLMKEAERRQATGPLGVVQAKMLLDVAKMVHNDYGNRAAELRHLSATIVAEIDSELFHRDLLRKLNENN